MRHITLFNAEITGVIEKGEPIAASDATKKDTRMVGH